MLILVFILFRRDWRIKQQTIVDTPILLRLYDLGGGGSDVELEGPPN